MNDPLGFQYSQHHTSSKNSTCHGPREHPGDPPPPPTLLPIALRLASLAPALVVPVSDAIVLTPPLFGPVVVRVLPPPPVRAGSRRGWEDVSECANGIKSMIMMRREARRRRKKKKKRERERERARERERRGKRREEGGKKRKLKRREEDIVDSR